MYREIAIEIVEKVAMFVKIDTSQFWAMVHEIEDTLEQRNLQEAE